MSNFLSKIVSISCPCLCPQFCPFFCPTLTWGGPELDQNFDLGGHPLDHDQDLYLGGPPDLDLDLDLGPPLDLDLDLGPPLDLDLGGPPPDPDLGWGPPLRTWAPPVNRQTENITFVVLRTAGDNKHQQF